MGERAREREGGERQKTNNRRQRNEGATLRTQINDEDRTETGKSKIRAVVHKERGKESKQKRTNETSEKQKSRRHI